jgi:hypothetical protein
MTGSLFPDLVPAVLPEPEALSADRRRTLRQRADIAAGRHPLRVGRLAGEGHPGSGHRCGDCAHRHPQRRGAGTYPKCDLNDTGSAATDCRAWWPACTRWEPRP